MSAARRTAIIMLGIMILEGWVLALSLHRSTREHIVSAYDPAPAGWTACALAIAVTAVFIRHALRAFPMIRERFFELHALKCLAVPFALITGSMEELWFRGALMDDVQMHAGGALAQIAVSALLFGLVHSIWGAFAGKWRVALGSMIATAALGGALAAVYLVGGRHVAPCIWAHIAINLAIEPWLLFAAASGGAAGSRMVKADPHGGRRPF